MGGGNTWQDFGPILNPGGKLTAGPGGCSLRW